MADEQKRLEILEKAMRGAAFDSSSVGDIAQFLAEAVRQIDVPAGAVLLVYSPQRQIPSGWVACDGQNNTPDMREAAVPHADLVYAMRSGPSLIAGASKKS